MFFQYKLEVLKKNKISKIWGNHISEWYHFFIRRRQKFIFTFCCPIPKRVALRVQLRPTSFLRINRIMRTAYPTKRLIFGAHDFPSFSTVRGLLFFFCSHGNFSDGLLTSGIFGRSRWLSFKHKVTAWHKLNFFFFALMTWVGHFFVLLKYLSY